MFFWGSIPAMGREDYSSDGSFEKPYHWPTHIDDMNEGDYVRKNGVVYQVVKIWKDKKKYPGAELVTIQEVDLDSGNPISGGTTHTEAR